MDKKIAIIVAAAVVLLLAGLGIYLQNKSGKSSETAEEAAAPAEVLTESATKGTLPSLETNPLENKPDLNPVDTANPFKNIKTNPFK